MTLWIIISILIVIVSFFIAKSQYYDRIPVFIVSLLFGICLMFMLFLFVEAFGAANNTTVVESRYTQKISSLSDNSQVSGYIYGAYIVRGEINEQQFFSFYRQNDDSSYTLDKREANKSVIYTDASPETANVLIIDHIYQCVPSWWLMCWNATDKAEFARAEFHVPEGTIKNDFELDAK